VPIAALMPALSTSTPTRNAWTCPTCRHGSPDPRDELAHLDAHRQLGQFLEEWDAAVESDRKKERGRRPVIVAMVGLLVVAVVVAGTVFLGLDRPGRSSGHVAGPVPGSIVPTPPPARAPGPALTPPPPEEASVPAQVTPQVTPTDVAPTDVAPSAPQSPGIASATAAAAGAPSAPPADAGVTAVPEPPTPAPASTTTLESLRAHPPAPAPAYLLKVCLGSCLTIP